VELLQILEGLFANLVLLAHDRDCHREILVSLLT
jgi:hypothetical protein